MIWQLARTVFLAPHLNRELLKEGVPVCVLAGDPARAPALEQAAADIRAGEFTRASSLEAAVKSWSQFFRLVSAVN